MNNLTERVSDLLVKIRGAKSDKRDLVTLIDSVGGKLSKAEKEQLKAIKERKHGR